MGWARLSARPIGLTRYPLSYRSLVLGTRRPSISPVPLEIQRPNLGSHLSGDAGQRQNPGTAQPLLYSGWEARIPGFRGGEQ